jgi:uncharacterized protein YegL
MVLDTSQSMEGEALSTLQAALGQWVADARAREWDEKTRDIYMAIVSYGGSVDVVSGDRSLSSRAFVKVKDLDPMALTAQGRTPLVPAVHQAIDLIAAMKDELKDQKLQYWRPLIWVVGDGEPTDATTGNFDDSGVDELASQLKTDAADAHYKVFALYVPHSDRSRDDANRARGVFQRLGEEPNFYGELSGLRFDKIVTFIQRSAQPSANPIGELTEGTGVRSAQSIWDSVTGDD